MLYRLSILKSFHRVSPGIKMGVESIFLSLGNLVIYCSFEEFKRLGLVLVNDDFLQFHQFFLIKGNGGFFICNIFSTPIFSQIPVTLWENQWVVFRQIFTNMSITGTSISTPTTVARAAPDERPKSMMAVAMATSK